MKIHYERGPSKFVIDWHPWCAWRPVWADTPTGYARVWLETIERRIFMCHAGTVIDYRTDAPTV